jgi:predicted Rossmann fold nucleotide-binding protein DprA/Smf involved in DNA uptake
VVVIESGAKSGSLIATHMALKQGHAVFAIPSALLNPKTQNGN